MPTNTGATPHPEIINHCPNFENNFPFIAAIKLLDTFATKAARCDGQEMPRIEGFFSRLRHAHRVGTLWAQGGVRKRGGVGKGVGMDLFSQDPAAEKVVQMNSFQARIGYAAMTEVESYWNRIRGTRLLPNRSDINPRDIESALEYAFILERIAPGLARIRVAGSHLNDLMGMEVRGMPVTSFFEPDGRKQVSNMLEEVFQAPAIAELNLSGEQALGRGPMEARALLLPLKSDLGDCSRILGCLMTKGAIGRTPRRFGVVRTRLRKLTDTAFDAPSRAPNLAINKTQPEAPKTQSTKTPPLKGAAPKTPPRKGAPHLRLVSSNPVSENA